jgi:hypothetical protein
MGIMARSEKHARQIIAKLKKQGYEYKMSYCYIQEWRKGDDIVLVGKGYDDRRRCCRCMY